MEIFYNIFCLTLRLQVKMEEAVISIITPLLATVLTSYQQTKIESEDECPGSRVEIPNIAPKILTLGFEFYIQLPRRNVQFD